jgi:hypothetical protein
MNPEDGKAILPGHDLVTEARKLTWTTDIYVRFEVFAAVTMKNGVF